MPNEIAFLPPVAADSSSALPAIFQAVPDSGRRFLEFFTVNIRNPNTRKAYFRAVASFAAWCEGLGLHDLSMIAPTHVAGYVEQLGHTHAKPTVKQHLAAVRMFFDWLITGQVIASNYCDLQVREWLAMPPAKQIMVFEAVANAFADKVRPINPPFSDAVRSWYINGKGRDNFDAEVKNIDQTKTMYGAIAALAAVLKKPTIK